MKKIAIILTGIFVAAFICCEIAVRFANDKLYNLLYPDDEVVFDESNPGTVTLKKGDWFTSGSYNGERLVWKCVTDSKVQCKKIIEFREYDDNSSDWKTSELRSWLNSDDGFAGNASVDKNLVDGEFCILSKDELKKTGQFTKQPTLSAIRNSGSKYLFLRRYCWYWTSSPVSTNSLSVTTVTQTNGFYKTTADDRLTGVCPAFNLKTDTVHILGGDGTKQKPYVIG